MRLRQRQNHITWMCSATYQIVSHSRTNVIQKSNGRFFYSMRSLITTQDSIVSILSRVPPLNPTKYDAQKFFFFKLRTWTQQ